MNNQLSLKKSPTLKLFPQSNAMSLNKEIQQTLTSQVGPSNSSRHRHLKSGASVVSLYADEQFPPFAQGTSLQGSLRVQSGPR